MRITRNEITAGVHPECSHIGAATELDSEAYCVQSEGAWFSKWLTWISGGAVLAVIAFILFGLLTGCASITDSISRYDAQAKEWINKLAELTPVNDQNPEAVADVDAVPFSALVWRFGDFDGASVVVVRRGGAADVQKRERGNPASWLAGKQRMVKNAFVS